MCSGGKLGKEEETSVGRGVRRGEATGRNWTPVLRINPGQLDEGKMDWLNHSFPFFYFVLKNGSACKR